MMRHPASFALCLLALSACAGKGPEVIVSGSRELTLRAELPEMSVLGDVQDEATKASTHYTIRINWTEGDRLSVINLTTGKILGGGLAAAESGPVTTFSGTVSGTIREGDRIAYLYPSQNNGSEMDFTSIHVDMSTQDGTTAGVPLCVYSTATAEGATFDDASISFSFLMSYIMSDVVSVTETMQYINLTDPAVLEGIKTITAGKSRP